MNRHAYRWALILILLVSLGCNLPSKLLATPTLEPTATPQNPSSHWLAEAISWDSEFGSGREVGSPTTSVHGQNSRTGRGREVSQGVCFHPTTQSGLSVLQRTAQKGQQDSECSDQARLQSVKDTTGGVLGRKIARLPGPV